MHVLDTLLQDVRFGIRVLLKTPGFSTIAVLVLALGIGVNCAIFSLVNALLFRPLPVPTPSALVGIYSRHTEPPGDYRAFAYPNYIDLRQGATGFVDVAAFAPSMVGVEVDAQLTRRAMTFLVSDSYFDTFGDALARGRGFLPEETEPRANVPVVVVSHDFGDRGGNDPDLLGQTLRINSRAYTIVGIAREGFTGTSAFLGPEFWLPLGVYASTMNDLFVNQGSRDLFDRGNRALMVVGRLRPGVTADAVAPELATIGTQLETAYPGENADQTIMAAPLSRVAVGTAPQTDREVRAIAVLLSSMAAIVLLIGCLNLANMLLARGHARRQEIAIRQSLGGGRRRVIRQLLTEGLLLSIAGSAIGLVVADWAINALMVSVMPMVPFDVNLPELAVDGRVLAATVVFSAMATLFFGLGPAWKLTRIDLVPDLKQQMGGGGGRRLLAGRNLLVVAQVALSLTLLTGGGLFVQGALSAAGRDPGFSLEQGLLVEVDPSVVGYDETRGRQLYRTLRQRLAAVPGVEGVGAASLVPFSGISEGRAIEPVRDATTDDAVRHSARYSIITPGYFDAVRLPMLRGRDFTEAEMMSDASPGVVIVDEPLAARFWPDPDVDPLGQYVRFVSATEARGAPLRVVGLVPGLRQEVFDQEPVPHVYVPFGDPYRSAMTLHVGTTARGADAENALISTVRETIRDVDARLPVFALETLRDHRDGSLELWIMRAGSQLFSTFGVVALLMAVIGIYGVKAYVVARRTREIGIRLALGATSGGVLWLLVREGLTLTAVGLGLGLVLSLPLGRVMQSVLFEVSTREPLVFLLAPAILAVPALLASYLPARRAAKVAPMSALRYE